MRTSRGAILKQWAGMAAADALIFVALGVPVREANQKKTSTRGLGWLFVVGSTSKVTFSAELLPEPHPRVLVVGKAKHGVCLLDRGR